MSPKAAEMQSGYRAAVGRAQGSPHALRAWGVNSTGGRPGSPPQASWNRHLTGPQRYLQLEACVWFVQLVAQQLAEAGYAVADCLRVEVQRRRHLDRVATVTDVGEGGLAHPLSRLFGERFARG